MFWQGFFFTLGFGAGSLAFASLLMGVTAMLECLWKRFRKPRRMEGAVNIRIWQERISEMRDANGDFRPAGQKPVA
jgi:hypothetical protein